MCANSHCRNWSIDAIASDDAVEEVWSRLVRADVAAARVVLVRAVLKVVVLKRLFVVIVVVAVVGEICRSLLLLRSTTYNFLL